MRPAASPSTATSKKHRDRAAATSAGAASKSKGAGAVPTRKPSGPSRRYFSYQPRLWVDAARCAAANVAARALRALRAAPRTS